MKKVLSAFAICVLTAGLVACAKPEEKPAPKTDAPKVVEETSKTTTTTSVGTASAPATASTTTTTTTTSTAPATK